MLKEYATQDSPKSKNRRWFSDENLDLIVWFDPRGRITGFQLCYDKLVHECALTWTEKDGYHLNIIDTGEEMPDRNDTPVLAEEHIFPKERVLERLRANF